MRRLRASSFVYRLPSASTTGQLPNQAIDSARLTTSPITSVAGDSIPDAAVREGSSDSVDTTLRWSTVVPRSTTAAGSSGERPPAINAAQTSSSFPAAMRTTSVSTAADTRWRSTSRPGAVLAVTTAKLEATPRCVSGMPAYAGTAVAEETPGTTSNGTLASAQASASSPPRPKTNGS